MPTEITSFIKRLLDLREGSDEKRDIIERVKDDGDFSSARFWTLVFAIGACSVGLNINSIPVIIGAMLISPLMGPIVSMGLSLSIYDWGLMRRSFRNLLILTAISIIISALYFALSPITNAQSELLARTQPTIFDVLIAIFGGMAGFIGISRAKHNNVIPGVAIATALMPPLCTVGYGLGTWQIQFVFGAFYLFLINSIFICLSALVVAKYLKLPKREYPDLEHRKRVNRIITFIILVIVTPAIYLAYTFVEQNNFNQNVESFVQEVFEDEGYVVIYENHNYTQSGATIELAFLSELFSEEQIENFKARLSDFGLDDAELIIRQNGFALTEEEWQSFLDEANGDDEKIVALEARLESEKNAFYNPTQLLEEAQTINSKIINIASGPLNYGLPTNAEEGNQLVTIVYTDTERSPLLANEAEVITKWLQTRLKNDSLIIYFVPEPSNVLGVSTSTDTITE